MGRHDGGSDHSRRLGLSPGRSVVSLRRPHRPRGDRMTENLAAVRRDHADGPPDLTVYPADERFTGPRPAVLVLPGGGYRFHSEHEGEGYARWLSGLGLHAFVLRYPLMTGHRYPAPL